MNKASLIIRVPSSLHVSLKRAALREGISLNRFCTSLLEKVDARGESAETTTRTNLRLAVPDSLESLIGEIREAFTATLIGIVLFGSQARGEATEQSDIDLAVVLKQEASLDRDIYDKWRREVPSGDLAEPLFLQLPAAADEIRGIWLELSLDGIVLLDTGFTLSGYLSRIRRMIAEGGVSRRTTYGTPYWIHNREGSPDSEGSS